MPRLTTRTPRMYKDRGRAYVKIDGNRVSLGRWGTPEAKEAYNRLVAEWLSNDRRMPEPTAEDEPVPIAEMLAEYTRHARQRYRQKKCSTIEGALKIVRSLYSSESVESFGPKRLRLVRGQMIDQNLSRGSVNEPSAGSSAPSSGPPVTSFAASGCIAGSRRCPA